MNTNTHHFYCNICKKTISKGAYIYSINTFGKALCLDHQKQQDTYQKTSRKLNTHTQKIQDLVKSIHKDDVHDSEVKLTDIKDWIHSDMETWKKALNKDKKQEYVVSSKKSDES